MTREKDRSAEQVMKACQIGVPRGKHAYEQLHDLLAECYSTIGRLVTDMARLESALAESRANDQTAMGWLADARMASGDNGTRMLPEFIEYLKSLAEKAAELEAARSALRKTIRTYRVDDQHWNPDERADALTEQAIKQELAR